MAVDSSTTSSAPLKMLFVPHFDKSHLIPIFEAARLFAARGQIVTIVAIPSIAAALQSTVDRDAASGRQISLHVVPPPSTDDGIPIENFIAFHTMEDARKIFTALMKVKERVEEFVLAARPDCIVTDFYPFAAGVAADLDIPRLLFSVASVLLQAIEEALERPNSPHLKLESDYDPFVVPGLPHRITLTRAQLVGRVFDPDSYAQMRNDLKQFQKKSVGILYNSFEELEPGYAEHYYKVSGVKGFPIGPVALIHRNDSEKAGRIFHTAALSEHECLRWLDSKKPISVVYACFGNHCAFPDEQLMEIACGLQDSGHCFLWVVPSKVNSDDDRKWLPEGFEERTKERGMIIKGRAPQVLILDHPSLGGFFSHCGWNSVTEGASAGVPMITWPVHSEQFYSEKLVTQVLRIGVECGAKENNRTFDMEKIVFERAKITNAVRRLMDGGDEAEGMRRRAKELSEMAKRAVAEGGSSHRNLTVVIDEIRRIRDQKTQA